MKRLDDLKRNFRIISLMLLGTLATLASVGTVDSAAAEIACHTLFKPAGLIRSITDIRSKVVTFEKPMAISSYIEIYGRREFYDERNASLGHALLFRPVEVKVKSLRQSRGGLDPYRTEIDGANRSLFEALGFKEGSDPTYGKFMAEVPDPVLFENLREIYNASVPSELRVEIGIYQSKVVSAHQSEILHHWIEEAKMAIGRPELGSVFGKSPEEIASAEVRDGAEVNSIYRHDLEHYASIFLIPKAVVSHNRKSSLFWQAVLKHLHGEVRANRIPKDNASLREALDASYIFVRRFHSLMHVTGMLVRGNGSVDVNTSTLNDFGDVARKETPTVHWTGLGFRPRWVDVRNLPFESRLLRLGLEHSKTTEEPVSIARAYDAVTNESLNQIEAFIQSQSVPATKAMYAKLAKDFGLDVGARLSPRTLQGLQRLTLHRYRAMGNNPPAAIGR